MWFLIQDFRKQIASSLLSLRSLVQGKPTALSEDTLAAWLRGSRGKEQRPPKAT